MIFLLLSFYVQDVSAKSSIDVDCFVTWVSKKSDLDESLSVWGHGDEDYSKISFSQDSKGRVKAKIGGFGYPSRNDGRDILILKDADDFIYVAVNVDVAHGRGREEFIITYSTVEDWLIVEHKKENSNKFYKLASARCR